MTSLSISNLSIQSSLTSSLQAEQSTLTLLSNELATQQKYSNLTDYSASDARTLISLQSTATQKQAYLSVINGVNSNLSLYDTTLTDLESLAAQGQSLANNNPSFDPSQTATLSIEAGNFLKSVGVDLNQQINGRYIYAGTRYTTTPVPDLSVLPASTLNSNIITDNSTLPSYDASALTEGISGQTVTVGGTVSAGQTASVSVNGTAYTYTVVTGDTTSSIATSLAALVTAGGVAASASNGVVTIANGATINSATATTASPAAYTTDQASVDTGFSVNYGLSSNNPAFQQLIAGLRYLQAAGNSTDANTYKTNITQAASLLTSAISSLDTVHTSVANNINIMANEKTSQNAAIANLTTQVNNIQQVDVTQVSVEITELQTILQASYAVTGDVEKLSIVSYLPA